MIFHVKVIENGTAADCYTYTIDIIEVLDGDTLNAVVDLGFETETEQTLRLRGLDAPEIESAEGRESKEFLESLLGLNMVPGPRSISPIIIRTTHSDKYDRYLVVVFVNEEYVNQKLIEEELAQIVT